MLALITAAVAFSAVGILVAILIAAVVYAVGVYILHAPQPVVGLIAFLVFVLLLVGNVGAG